MPNSSRGQQEEEGVEVKEVEEVGEGGREQDLGQQDEERVVKRRITVSRRPTSRRTSVPNRRLLQSVSVPYFVPVKVNTMRVGSSTKKGILTLFCES